MFFKTQMCCHFKLGLQPQINRFTRAIETESSDAGNLVQSSIVELKLHLLYQPKSLEVMVS